MDSFVEFALNIKYIDASIVSIIILILNIYILRKSFYNIADPFLYFTIFNSFAITTTFFVSEFKDSYKSVLELLVFNLCFFAPSIIFHAKPKKNNLRYALNSFGGDRVDIFMGVLAAFTFLFTLILWIFVGVPFLAEDITNAKVTMYQGGFGFLRYLQMIAPPILSLYAMLEMYRTGVTHVKKFLMLLYIVMSAFASISGGSKGSLIYLLFDFGLLIYVSNNLYLIAKYKKHIFLIFLISCFLLLIILNSSEEGSFKGVILRFFASGDVYFFWYAFDLSPLLSSFKPFDFFIYLLSPLLGMLKISTYDYPIGAVIMNEATNYPLSSFGPNAQLPMLMRMFFSDYSYFVIGIFGFIFYYLRMKSYVLVRRFGAPGFCLFIILHLWVTSIFVDINFFMSIIFSSLIIFATVYGISVIVYYSLVSLNKKNSKNSFP